jgi:hypothetical protein
MLALARAKNQGELNPDANPDVMADFFESTLAGIRMAAKAGKKRRALRNIAAFAGRAYMGSDLSTPPEGATGLRTRAASCVTGRRSNLSESASANVSEK